MGLQYNTDKRISRIEINIVKNNRIKEKGWKRISIWISNSFSTRLVPEKGKISYEKVNNL